MSNKQKLNIAYIISMPNGLDAWTFREIELLMKNNINITIFPLRYASGPYMPKKSWDCYHYKNWLVLLRQFKWLIKYPKIYFPLLFEAFKTGTLTDFLLSNDIVKQMVDRKIEMIHCVFGDHKLFIGYYCKKILKVPLSVALYGYDLRVNPNWPMFHKAIKFADTIIVNCNFNKQLLSQIAGSEVANKAKIVRHFAEVPIDDYQKKIKILIVGGFVERKGHDLLFEAISALGKDANNIEVWVAGYPGSVDMEQLAHKIGVEDKVRIFGSMTDSGLDFLYRNCDIFCLPSKTDKEGRNEGLPVAIIEAMAYGKPVIASRLAGIPELVEEILVDEGDVKGIVKAIKRLKDNPNLRKSSGARNLEVVKNLYSKKNVLLMQDLWLDNM